MLTRHRQQRPKLCPPRLPRVRSAAACFDLPGTERLLRLADRVDLVVSRLFCQGQADLREETAGKEISARDGRGRVEEQLASLPRMTSEDTPMTPAAPVVDERQKALDKYKERLLKHRHAKARPRRLF
jgi:hypothetical protein